MIAVGPFQPELSYPVLFYSKSELLFFLHKKPSVIEQQYLNAMLLTWPTVQTKVKRLIRWLKSKEKRMVSLKLSSSGIARRWMSYK